MSEKYKNYLGNSHQSLILWYIWSEPTFGKAAPPFAPLFRAPPFCHPFIFIPLEWKNQNFPLFRGRTQYSWVPRWRCPPFLPPLFEFLESPKHDLQILYVSFFVKMCCFCSTDPCHKNELAILLWSKFY